MQIYAKNKEDRLAEVQGIYQKAQLAAVDQRKKFDMYDKQYRGDKQIDGYIEGESGEYAPPEDAKICWNLSYKLLEGSIDTNIPQPLVTPELKCEHHVRNAARIENLIKMIIDKQPWETYNDEQERTVGKNGTGASNIEWDVTSATHKTVGEVEVTPLRPHNIYPQPGIRSIDDCDYIFVNYVTTRAELMRRYSLTEDDVEQTEYAAEYDISADISQKPTNDEDVVTITVLWYLNEKGDVCRFSFSGSLILEDDDDYYSRKVEYCRTCGRRRQICEKSECSSPDYFMNKLDFDELEEDIVCSDGRIIPAFTPEYKDGEMVFETVRVPVTAPDGSQMTDIVGGVELPAFTEVQVPKMKKTRLPYYKPKKLPLAIRYYIKDDASFWGISLMEILREPQQEVNKLISRIQEAVMKQGAALFLPQNVTIEPSNGIFKEIYRVGSGVDKEQFGEFEYKVDISPWMAMLDRFIDLGSDLSGVTDTFLGQADNTAKSGYAKSIQVAQSSGRLASMRQNKHSFYAEIFRVIFELYLAFADEPREIHHEDGNCILAAGERFNRYDYYEFDPKTGEWYIDDNYAFSIDPNGAMEQQYAQLWEIVKSDFSSGMYGDPTQIDSQIFCWQHLERLKYPFARDVVESLKGLKEMMKQAQMPPANGAPAAEGQGVPSQSGATVNMGAPSMA